MLPVAYQLPAAAFLVAGGLLSCLFGFRLFRIVLAVFGFIIGGLAASSLLGESAAGWMMAAAIAGGLVGAVVLLTAYFVGVALIGAGLGALVAHLIWARLGTDPHPFVVILAAVMGAVLATWLQRYVIVLATAFGGAWTAVVGVAALRGQPEALRAAASGDIWVAYPMNPAPGQEWVPWAFVAMGLIGTLVQLYWTAGDRGRVGRARRRKSSS